MIRILSIAIAAFFILASSSGSQALMGDVIFGNPDASTIYAPLDSDIEIGVWVSFDDEVIGFLHIPLSSNDSIIASRNGGEFFYPLSEWDDVSFLDPHPDTTLPGYTNQSILGFYDLGGGPNPPLNLFGDTVLIANYFMHTTDDTTHLYELVCPFAEGWHPANGHIIIGDYGTILPMPEQTFSCLFLVDYYPGDANNSGDVNGIDVIYLVNYLKGNGPSPEPYLGGDTNGDCWVNGPDVIYLVNYLKGAGQPPFYGNCH